MNRDPDERAQPDRGPVDDEFEAIVAGWRREGRVPLWPDDRGPAALFEPGSADPESRDASPLEPGPLGLSPEPSGPGGPGRSDPGEPEPAESSPGGTARAEPAPIRPSTSLPEDEHFVPPEPPPLPRLGPPAIVGLLLLGAGLLLLVSPGWLGVAERYGLPLGLVGIAAGLGWLVLRLWPDSPSADDDPRRDDGAVL